jgi:hypothetical protein
LPTRQDERLGEVVELTCCRNQIPGSAKTLEPIVGQWSEQCHRPPTIGDLDRLARLNAT